MNKPEDYVAMMEWNRRMGTSPVWNLHTAIREHAPIDAIYMRPNGKWATVSDMHDGHEFRVWYETEVLKQPVRPRRSIVTLHVRVDFPPSSQLPAVDEAAIIKAMNLPPDSHVEFAWVA